MQTVVIDCAGVQSADEFWQRYLTAVQPEGAAIFGRNLDAFWDAVEAGGPGQPNAKLVFKNTSGLEANFLNALRRIASDATHTEIELL